MTLDDNAEPHDRYAKVSNDECTKAIFRATLSSENEEIRMFYAAELDAMDSGKISRFFHFLFLLSRWKQLRDEDNAENVPGVAQEENLGSLLAVILGKCPTHYLRLQKKQRRASCVQGKWNYV